MFKIPNKHQFVVVLNALTDVDICVMFKILVCYEMKTQYESNKE